MTGAGKTGDRWRGRCCLTGSQSRESACRRVSVPQRQTQTEALQTDSAAPGDVISVVTQRSATKWTPFLSGRLKVALSTVPCAAIVRLLAKRLEEITIVRRVTHDP